MSFCQNVQKKISISQTGKHLSKASQSSVTCTRTFWNPWLKLTHFLLPLGNFDQWKTVLSSGRDLWPSHQKFRAKVIKVEMRAEEDEDHCNTRHVPRNFPSATDVYDSSLFTIFTNSLQKIINIFVEFGLRRYHRIFS